MKGVNRIAIENMNDNKIGRAYAEAIEETSNERFKPFFERQNCNDKAEVFTGGWGGY